MNIASLIVSVFLALVLLASGAMKARRAPAVVANLTPLGVPERTIPGLGALEIAAALGLLAGLFWWPLGLAAAIGSVAYFVGAISTHLRARDSAIAPAAGMLAVCVAALILILLAR